jgi:hypothetical protein
MMRPFRVRRAGTYIIRRTEPFPVEWISKCSFVPDGSCHGEPAAPSSHKYGRMQLCEPLWTFRMPLIAG